MASRKTLKRTITNISEALFAECVAASLYSHDRQCGETLIYSTVKMQDHFVRRISHQEPGMPAKEYYRDLWEKFVAQVSEITDHINNL
ncbi:MAG: hypothetical protein IJ637_03165 [Prevotella sp.]|nr:hypothetical protein [Prevotella sp.]